MGEGDLGGEGGRIGEKLFCTCMCVLLDTKQKRRPLQIRIANYKLFACIHI